MAPVRDSLSKVDAQIQQMEVARGEAYGDLRAQVQSLITTQKELQSETGNLVRALRTPNVRGRWGEIQLRRVVEIAGMLPYCDFAEQETIFGESGRSAARSDSEVARWQARGGGCKDAIAGLSGCVRNYGRRSTPGLPG